MGLDVDAYVRLKKGALFFHPYLVRMLVPASPKSHSSLQTRVPPMQCFQGGGNMCSRTHAWNAGPCVPICMHACPQVEAVDGLFLAAFHRASDALLWALECNDHMIKQVRADRQREWGKYPIICT